MFRKLLVPLDGSELAEKALNRAIEMAKSEGSSLLLVRVVSLAAISTEYSSIAYIESLNRMQDEAQNYLSTVVDSLQGERLSVSGTVLVGNPATRVVEFAEEREADLIVLSSHGRTGIAKWYYGSVAESITRLSSRPTLLLPQKCRGEIRPTQIDTFKSKFLSAIGSRAALIHKSGQDASLARELVSSSTQKPGDGCPREPR